MVSSPGEASTDGTFEYQVEASDPDGDRNLQFHLELILMLQVLYKWMKNSPHWERVFHCSKWHYRVQRH